VGAGTAARLVPLARGDGTPRELRAARGPALLFASEYYDALPVHA
jgi:hypothetical protein